MTPGDIVMLLNEMGGMRVQSTSPSLGAGSGGPYGQRRFASRILTLPAEADTLRVLS